MISLNVIFLEPGIVRNTFIRVISVGRYQNGRGDFSERVAQAFMAAGMPTTNHHHIMRVKWTSFYDRIRNWRIWLPTWRRNLSVLLIVPELSWKMSTPPSGFASLFKICAA
jgi:hypothetical protein